MSNHHSSPGNEPDQVNNGALAMVLGLVAFSTLAIALVVTALVRDEVGATKATRDLTQENGVRTLRAGQLGTLEASPSWLDRASGVVSLPIDRAMALTLAAVRQNPYKLSPWAPAADKGMGGASGQGEEEAATKDAQESKEGSAKESKDAAGKEAKKEAPGKAAPAKSGAPKQAAPKAAAPAPAAAPAQGAPQP